MSSILGDLSNSLSSAQSVEGFLQLAELLIHNDVGDIDLWLVQHGDNGYEVVARDLDYLVPGLSGVLDNDKHPAIVAIENKTPVWVARLSELHKTLKEVASYWEEELDVHQVFAIPMHSNALKALLGISAQPNFLSGTNKDLLLETAQILDHNLQELIDTEFLHDQVRDQLEHLTPRQLRILVLMGTGKSNREIAVELDISESTIRIEAAEIYKAIGVENRSAAALFASKNHIV